jgi:hypothetical protein
LTTRLPGSRSDIRERSTTVAMHLLRRLLVQDASRESAADRLPDVSAGRGR